MLAGLSLRLWADPGPMWRQPERRGQPGGEERLNVNVTGAGREARGASHTGPGPGSATGAGSAAASGDGHGRPAKRTRMESLSENDPAARPRGGPEALAQPFPSESEAVELEELGEDAHSGDEFELPGLRKERPALEGVAAGGVAGQPGLASQRRTLWQTQGHHRERTRNPAAAAAAGAAGVSATLELKVHSSGSAQGEKEIRRSSLPPWLQMERHAGRQPQQEEQGESPAPAGVATVAQSEELPSSRAGGVSVTEAAEQRPMGTINQRACLRDQLHPPPSNPAWRLTDHNRASASVPRTEAEERGLGSHQVRSSASFLQGSASVRLLPPLQTSASLSLSSNAGGTNALSTPTSAGIRGNPSSAIHLASQQQTQGLRTGSWPSPGALDDTFQESLCPSATNKRIRSQVHSQVAASLGTALAAAQRGWAAASAPASVGSAPAFKAYAHGSTSLPAGRSVSRNLNLAAATQLASSSTSSSCMLDLNVPASVGAAESALLGLQGPAEATKRNTRQSTPSASGEALMDLNALPCDTREAPDSENRQGLAAGKPDHGDHLLLDHEGQQAPTACQAVGGAMKPAPGFLFGWAMDAQLEQRNDSLDKGHREGSMFPGDAESLGRAVCKPKGGLSPNLVGTLSPGNQMNKDKEDSPPYKAQESPTQETRVAQEEESCAREKTPAEAAGPSLAVQASVEEEISKRPTLCWREDRQLSLNTVQSGLLHGVVSAARSPRVKWKVQDRATGMDPETEAVAQEKDTKQPELISGPGIGKGPLTLESRLRDCVMAAVQHGSLGPGDLFDGKRVRRTEMEQKDDALHARADVDKNVKLMEKSKKALGIVPRSAWARHMVEKHSEEPKAKPKEKH